MTARKAKSSRSRKSARPRKSPRGKGKSRKAPAGKATPRKTPAPRPSRPKAGISLLGRLKGRIDNWRSRHRNPVSFMLHMLGIPACFVAAPILAIMGLWLMALIFFVAGYALQFLGHLIEGNRSGEEMLLRRLLGRQ